MAKTAYSIWMDFRNADKQADALEEIARTVRQTAAGDLTDCLEEMAVAWVSDNSTAYRKKCAAVADQLEEIARNLEKSAETVRTIAANTYDAEMAALATATTRTYR